MQSMQQVGSAQLGWTGELKCHHPDDVGSFVGFQLRNNCSLTLGMCGLICPTNHLDEKVGVISHQNPIKILQKETPRRSLRDLPWDLQRISTPLGPEFAGGRCALYWHSLAGEQKIGCSWVNALGSFTIAPSGSSGTCFC